MINDVSNINRMWSKRHNNILASGNGKKKIFSLHSEQFECVVLPLYYIILQRLQHIYMKYVFETVRKKIYLRYKYYLYNNSGRLDNIEFYKITIELTWMQNKFSQS